MKILFTTSFYPPYHIGGDAVHVKYLAEALVEEGHEVHVLHSIDAYNFKRKEKRTPEKSRVKIHTLKSPLGKLEPILNYILGTQKHTMNYFKKLIKEEKFDVVHHHNISLLGYNILRKQDKYVNLYTAHDYWLLCHKYDMDVNNDLCQKKQCFSCTLRHKKPYQFYRHFSKFKKSLNAIDTIIAPSQFMADMLKTEFNNVKVIQNFIPEPKPTKIKTKNHFIYAGVLGEHKGVLNLVKVFSEIDKPLLIVGSGELEEKLKKVDKKNIEVLGFTPHSKLFPLIESAQALILPSLCHENNPLICLESLSLGTPVIGSDAGGIPEIVQKIDDKLIFPKHDIDKLKKIIMDFDRGKYPQDKMRNIYKKHFSKEVFLKKYYSLIK